MKKKRNVLSILSVDRNEILLKMKLLTLLLFAAFVSASASCYSQATKFNLNLKDATINDVFQKIEEQSEFIILFNDKNLNVNRKVNIIVMDQTVDKILDQIFEGDKDAYKIFDRQIVIFPNEISKILPSENKNIEAQQPQKKELSGTVKDSKGLPLPGVTVVVKGTTIGTLSDNDGKFRLSVPTDAKTLVFSFVGMKSQEFPVADKTTFSIVMAEEAVGLDDVVVVAYGTQKKVSVTGAVSSIVTKELKQSPSPNLVGALAGRLPGLITVQNSGQPGNEGFAIYLRGASTTNGQNPLILIDGVPRDNITTIDPNEVASISILKDASSTAVFGVRGANGVILITTKQGISDTPQLNVTAEFGLQDFVRKIKTVNSWEYAALRNEARANDGLSPQFSQDQINKYKSGLYSFMYPNTDWYDLIMRKNTPLSRYNVNASGGTDRVKYFMNMGLTHQGGMFNTEPKSKLGYDPQFKMDRYNFRTNLDININSWIKSSINLAGYIEKVNAAGGAPGSVADPSYIILGINGTPPTQPVLTIPGYGVPADQPIGSQSGTTSYANLNRTGFVSVGRCNLNSSAAFDFDLKWITKGLTSKVMASLDYLASTSTVVLKQYDFYNYTLIQSTDPGTGVITDQLTFIPITPVFHPLSDSKSTTFAYNVNLQWAINYVRTFNNKHQVTGMILAQRDNREAASGTSDILLPYNVLGVSGRVTYGYDNRYLMEFNAGYNGSEQFQSNRRFGFFPAASIGWVASNENFMKNQKVITNLKLRASYGKVGNDKLGNDRFLYLDNINTVTGGFSPSLGLGNYVSEDLVGNPLISWETAYKQNYGIEFTLFNGLSFTGDLFFEDRKDILITRQTVPALQGIPLSSVPKANMGEVFNKGYELELAYNKMINKDLSFVIRGNYNFNQNTVKNIDEIPYDETYAFPYRRTGYSLSQNWGYEIDWKSLGHGYYTSKDEINNSGLTFVGVQPRPGDFVYKDLNGDKIIDVKDQAPIKYGVVPRITYGVNLSITYKGLDFAALIQGVGQTSQYYSSWGITEDTGGFTDYQLNAWTKERYEAGQKITYPALSTSTSTSLTSNSFFVFDRSYVRLKNAEIGYTLPKRWSKRIGAEKFRVYANGQNIFLWDKLPTKSIDPEQSGARSIPIVRVFNLGANIVF